MKNNIIKSSSRLVWPFCLIRKQSQRCITSNFLLPYPADNRTVYPFVYLEFPPLDDEKAQDANENVNVIEWVLRVNGKFVKNLFANIRVSCTTKPSVANKLKRYFLKSTSHRFHLAVLKRIAEDSNIFYEVEFLMIRLRTTFMQNWLSKHTNLKAKLENETEGMSKYDVLRRHTTFCYAVSELGD